MQLQTSTRSKQQILYYYDWNKFRKCGEGQNQLHVRRHVDRVATINLLVVGTMSHSECNRFNFKMNDHYFNRVHSKCVYSNATDNGSFKIHIHNIDSHPPTIVSIQHACMRALCSLCKDDGNVTLNDSMRQPTHSKSNSPPCNYLTSSRRSKA